MTVARLVAGFFGAGRFPVGAGTFASAVALAGGVIVLQWGPGATLAAAGAALAAGLWAIPAAGVKGDPGWVVIDEVAGQLLALSGLARPGWAGAAAAFVLFRALDIGKPGPVGRAERLPGAWGVMADDLVAGAGAAGVLLAVRAIRPDLLG